MSFSLKRRFPFYSSTLVENPVPVTDSKVDMSGRQAANEGYHNLNRSKTAGLPVMTGTLSLQHLHTIDSVCTSTSSSNNSSPTTTISTADSATTDNDSPNSLPNSPGMSMVPLSEIASKNSGGEVSAEDMPRPPSSSHSYASSISPSKKPRNTKNLSLNVPPPAPSSRQHRDPSSILNPRSPRSMSAPNSPAFIVPPPPPAPKRRPSNLGLTIQLPSTLPDRGTRSGLRHHQSSPSLFTPGPNGLAGGMKLPPHPRLYQPPRQTMLGSQDSLSSSLSSSSSASPPRTPPPPLNEMDEEDEPLSNEASKSPAYPSGPICIFEPNIFLFAEPDADLASTFDVVINVAREVLNPFDVAAEKAKKESEAWRMSIIPDTACTDASFTTAFEEATFSPLRTVPFGSQKTYKMPHYVHMPWDHNTNILDDLPDLVKLIDENASERKRVLVHCQCGVSRSASLLIAYSLFKNPQQTVQEAYDSVKNKSKWIGPNMSLIYQLSDWRSRLIKEKSFGSGGWKQGNAVGGVRGLIKGSGNFGRLGRCGGSMSVDMGRVEDIPEPLTAPLPSRPPTTSLLPSKGIATKNHPVPHMVRTRSENGGFISGVAPGPSSAPPGMITIPKSPSPPPSSLISDEKLWNGSEVPPPLPPSAAYAIRPEDEKRPFDASQDSDIPPTPTFKSPRNSGYFGFGIPIRRDLPGGIGFADPRSPNRGTETPIIRSIFDVL